MSKKSGKYKQKMFITLFQAYFLSYVHKYGHNILISNRNNMLTDSLITKKTTHRLITYREIFSLVIDDKKLK